MHIRPSMISLALPGLLTAVLCGCATNTEQRIPAGARPVRVGQGVLDYASEEDGVIYVLDATTYKKIFDRPVKRGDPILVDPVRDRIVVAGEVAEHKTPLSSDHVYRLYFDRAQ